MKIPSLALSALVLAAGLGAASGANAAWTFSSVSGGVSTATDGGISVTASGVFAANGGSYTNSTTYNISGFGTGAKWASGALISYSGGLGMSSDGSVSPNHAIDNGPKTNSSGTVTGLGNTEAVLLSFGSSVVLNSITTGYVSRDSDFSVFKYDGSSAPTLTGSAASTMSGWTLVGNYGVSNVGTTTVNSGLSGSSWWLISAYNTAWGTTSANGGLLGQGNDYFKLLAVAGTKTPSGGGGSVPEPASLALVGAALLGIMGSRRRVAVRR